MADTKSTIDSELSPEDAYVECLKTAQVAGLPITNKSYGEAFTVENRTRPPYWWAICIVGFVPLVIPGIAVALLWNPTWHCTLTFRKGEAPRFKSAISVSYSGLRGEKFYKAISASLTAQS